MNTALYRKTDGHEVELPDTKLTKDDIEWAIDNSVWQELRVSLKGTSTDYKIDAIRKFWELNGRSKRSTVCVMNYINALRRGGQIRGYRVTK